MKKAIILALVLIVVFSSPLFSEALDCQQSFELGKNDAQWMHRSWQWYLLGIGSAILAAGASRLVLTLQLLAHAYDVSEVRVFALHVISLTVVLAVPFVPALLFPKRENISPYSSHVDLECYRDGYKRRANRKNSGALALGELTVVAFSFVMVVFLFRGVPF